MLRRIQSPYWDSYTSSGWTWKRLIDWLRRLIGMIWGHVKGLFAFIADLFRSKGKWDGVGIGV